MAVALNRATKMFRRDLLFLEMGENNEIRLMDCFEELFQICGIYTCISLVISLSSSCASSQANDKYFKVEVAVNAPVLILPISETSRDGFMVDLGSLAIQNTLLVPDQSQVQVGIDAYGIKLDSFKVSRSVLNTEVVVTLPAIYLLLFVCCCCCCLLVFC